MWLWTWSWRTYGSTTTHTADDGRAAYWDAGTVDASDDGPP